MKNKEVNNVEKYTYLSALNLNKAENAVEHLVTILGEEISSDELFDVIDMTYDKDNKDIQIQEVSDYVGVKKSDKKANFWIRMAIKYYGLHNWAEYMKNKTISVGE